MCDGIILRDIYRLNKVDIGYFNENRRLRVGILLNDRSLEDWEYGVFYLLFSDPRIEVVLLIQDGRNFPKGFALIKKLKLVDFLFHALIAVLKRFILWIEKNKKTSLLAVHSKKFVDDMLKDVKRILLYPKQIGYVDKFTQEDLASLKENHLDLLLRHQFGIISGAILNLPQYGIWSFHHADNDVIRGGPTGFWEVFYKHPVTGVTLQKLTHELDGGVVIDKGFYSTLRTWYNNQEFVLEKSVELFKKNINILLMTGDYSQKKSGNYSKKLFRHPSPIQLVQYILLAYPSIFFSQVKKHFLFFNKNRNVWMLHLGKGDILHATMWRTKLIKSPKNEFWADPFMCQLEDEKKIIFFENYEYSKSKAKISYIKLEHDKIIGKGDAIETDYHMSYPQIINYQSQWYIIPETSEKNRLEIWVCAHFPSSWRLLKTAFDNTNIADATIFKHPESGYWLFASISYDTFGDHDSHLYIFKIDSPLMSSIIPHELNPVITDSRRARPAGEIFICSDGRIIRPSQGNIDNNYGGLLNFNEIKKLTLSEYSEELILTINPEFINNISGCHHYTGNHTSWCVDVKYTKRPCMRRRVFIH